MKLSPKKKVTKKKIPTINEYKKTLNNKDRFIATAFSLGLALTPLTITSCNSDALANKQVKINTTKKVKSNTKKEKKIEKTQKTLGEMPPCDSDKKDDTNNKIIKPQQLGGVPARIDNDKLKKDNKKDNKKKDDTKKDVEKVKDPIKQPLKLKGKRVAHPNK